MATKVFLKTKFGKMIDQYIEHMRNLGRKFKVDKTILYAFDNFCYDNQYDGELCQDIFMRYCYYKNITLSQRGKRYRLLFNFYEYCRIFDDSLPPIARQAICEKKHKYIAHAYEKTDIINLINGVKLLPQANNETIYRWQCAFGLLACTGMRISELLNLKLKDIDFQNKTFTIKETKFRKNRIIVVKDSALKAIKTYLPFRNPHATVDNLFVSNRGGVWGYGPLNQTFNKVLKKINLTSKVINKPRIHDLRHTFALNQILEWQKNDEDVHENLVALSTYMGHSHYEDTLYYLEFSEKILKGTLNKFQFIGEKSHEVR